MESHARLQLEVLSRRLRAVEQGWRPEDDGAAAQVVETAAGALPRRRLHEWLGVEEVSQEAVNEPGLRKRWTPAMAVLIDAAGRVWRDGGGGLVVWIGRSVWPYAVSLPAPVMADSIMIDVPRLEDRLWAIDLALRSQAAIAVVADGSGLSLRATRRLQLAAEAGRALAMLARPAHEASQRSAAACRWSVRTAPASMPMAESSPVSQHNGHGNPRWVVELLRGTNAAWSRQSTGRIVEWRHGEGLVFVSALVVDSAGAAKKLRA